MESSTQASTKGTRQPSSIPDEEAFISDDSQNDHSFEVNPKSYYPKHLYLTTNLITNRNITLADVQTEEVTLKQIARRVARQEVHNRFKLNPYGRVDPRAEYKRQLSIGPLSTMVPYDEIEGLCQVALEVRKETLKGGQPRGHGLVPNVQDLMRQLESRVAHDHNFRREGPDSNDVTGHEAVIEGRTYKSRQRKRQLKQDRKEQLEKALFLINDCKASLKTVQSRLGLK